MSLLIKQSITCALVTAAAIFISLHQTNADSDVDGIKVLTRNLYNGSPIAPILLASQGPDPLAITHAATEAFQTVQATNFPERAEALVDEIDHHRPNVIGLQEVSQYFIYPDENSLVDGASPSSEPVYDYLEILLAALDDRGLDYAVAAVVENFDMVFPMTTGTDDAGSPTFADLRFRDRDAVLVENAADVSFRNEYSNNFGKHAHVHIGTTTIPRTRGYNMLDVKVKGAEYRFVNTHLETSFVIQSIQMSELLNEIDETTEPEMPVILVGDFNSRPDDTPVEYRHLTYQSPYSQAIERGYDDLWLSYKEETPKKESDDGFTCCFDPMVSDKDAKLRRRGDYIFVDFKKREIVRRKAKLVGDSHFDMTDDSGLYPSDHAGVIGEIKLAK